MILTLIESPPQLNKAQFNAFSPFPPLLLQLCTNKVELSSSVLEKAKRKGPLNATTPQSCVSSEGYTDGCGVEKFSQ